MRSPFVELLADLGAILDRLNIAWYLFGAQAAALYGVARATADVDVTLRLDHLTSRALLEELESRGFALRIDDDEFITRTRVIPVVHVSTKIPADLVLAGPGLEDLFFSRVQTLDFGGVTIPVAAPEDVVTMKILAGRPKDLEDVESILAARADVMNLSLIREMLSLLEQSLDQRDLLPDLERALARAKGL